jgi:hypothetical protein
MGEERIDVYFYFLFSIFDYHQGGKLERKGEKKKKRRREKNS